MSSLRRRTVLAGAAALVTVGFVTGCVPEPAPSASSSPATSASSSPSGSESPTPVPEESLVLPTSCEQLYSPGMLAALQGDFAPLNDPGTTMLSTENATAIEILGSASQSLRCTWGPPSERGIATVVTVVTPEQRDALFAAFEDAGFSAEDLGSGTIHSIEREMITLDDVLVKIGETHYLRGDAWIATRWIAAVPEGYTQDIVASLWG